MFFELEHHEAWGPATGIIVGKTHAGQIDLSQ
jgi:hypothetical protein